MQQHDAGAAKDGEGDLKKEFLDLVNGKYKDVYTAETQRIINRRFGEESQGSEDRGRTADHRRADAPLRCDRRRHEQTARGL